MKQFEYRVVYSDITTDPSLVYDLNEMGKDGWELVSISNHPQVGGVEKNIFGIAKKSVLVFKREIVEP